MKRLILFLAFAVSIGYCQLGDPLSKIIQENESCTFVASDSSSVIYDCDGYFKLFYFNKKTQLCIGICFEKENIKRNYDEILMKLRAQGYEAHPNQKITPTYGLVPVDTEIYCNSFFCAYIQFCDFEGIDNKKMTLLILNRRVLTND